MNEEMGDKSNLVPRFMSYNLRFDWKITRMSLNRCVMEPIQCFLLEKRDIITYNKYIQ